MKLVDCHAHLDEFKHPGEVLQRAASAGVEEIIALGTNTSTSLRILKIARDYQSPRIFPALGLYPDEVTPQEIESILNLIDEQRSKLVALGEIGLDYWIKPLRKKQPNREAKKELQQKAFRLQLQRAGKYSLAPIIHSRGAWADSYRLVKEEGIKQAVFHWYSGPLDVLESLLAAGYYISATPAAAYSPPHRAALEIAPLDRIILETDCPVPRREGEERILTEPADVFRSLKAVSQLKKVPEEEVALATTDNACRLFKLDNIIN